MTAVRRNGWLMLGVFASLWLASRVVWVGLRGYVQGDWGLLLNVPWRILRGEVPYRDFYAGNYTPGSYYFHAFLMKIFGVRADVITSALAFSQSVSVVLTYRLARRWMAMGAAMVAGLAAWMLAFPTVPMGFPAVYCVTFALAAVWFAAQGFDHPRPTWNFAAAGLCVGLAVAFKISAGGFLAAVLIWAYLAECGHRRALLGFSAVLFVAVLALLRPRFYAATILLFAIPMMMLAVHAARFFEKPKIKCKLRPREWLVFLIPCLIVTLLWALPFLWILGFKNFLGHFLLFPAKQARVLYYAPALPLHDGFSTFAAHWGFSTMASWKSLWKLWIYLPCAVAVFCDGPALLVALNCIWPLQMFPTIDHLHWAWSAHAAFLLLAFAMKGRPVWRKTFFAIVAVVAVFEIAYAFDYWHRKGPYEKLASARLALHVPAEQAQNFDAVEKILRDHRQPGEWVWNPPGSLLNFSLNNPVPISTDYLGPKYFSEDEVAALLEELKRRPPAWVVVPRNDEAWFGWAAFVENYPQLAGWVAANYSAFDGPTAYFMFKAAF